MKTKRACVTGATGCVGRNLVSVLEKEGDWDITVLHRKSSDLSKLNGCDVHPVEVNLHDADSVLKALPDQLDAVFHIAGNTSHWSKEAATQRKDNVLATRNLVMAALKKDIKRFIFTSTGATLPFQDTDREGAEKIDEPYIKTKRLAEIEVQEAAEFGLNTVTLHPIIVVGPYDYNSYSEIFRQLKHSPIKAVFPGSIAFCHAEDVARAHLQAYERGSPGSHYVLGGTHTTWLEMSQKISRLLGVREPRRATPSWVLKPVAHAMTAFATLTHRKPLLTPELLSLIHDTDDIPLADRARARSELGYVSRPLDQMLEDCLEWLKSEGRI